MATDMPKQKMPGELWLGWNPGWNCAEHKIDGYGTKYIRADLAASELDAYKRVAGMMAEALKTMSGLDVVQYYDCYYNKHGNAMDEYWDHHKVMQEALSEFAKLEEGV